MSPEELRHIVLQFQISGEVISVEKFGSGNINDTYRSTVRGFSSDKKQLTTSYYIHQKINQAVFPDPVKVVENMVTVTDHIQEKLREKQQGPSLKNTCRTMLMLIPTKEGCACYQDARGEYWRTTNFIPDTIVYEVIQDLDHAYQVGKMLGEFQKFVADIAPERLHDTLPGFHHTPRYYAEFLSALNTVHPDSSIEARKREPEVADLIKKLQHRESLGSLLMSPYNAGILSDRVVHNDPKVNNMLFNRRTREGICLIDLDTVKSGLIHFDYGDCLRSAANPAGEIPDDIRHVWFDLNIFEQLTQGYLEEAQAFLSSTDIEYLVDSIKVLTYELAIRFLTDYLKGDVYFRVSDSTRNLNRAKVQYTLLESVEKQEREIRKIMKALI